MLVVGKVVFTEDLLTCITFQGKEIYREKAQKSGWERKSSKPRLKAFVCFCVCHVPFLQRKACHFISVSQQLILGNFGYKLHPVTSSRNVAYIDFSKLTLTWPLITKPWFF